MSTWTDNTGQDWVVSVTVNTARLAKELAGVDILDVFDGKLLTRLSTDPVALVETFFAVCSKQAETRTISYEQFVDLMVGDALERAIHALVTAIQDFFPSGRREILRRLWAKVATTDKRAVEMAAAKIDSPAANQAIETAIAEMEAEIDERLSVLGSGLQNAKESAA